MKHGNNQQHQKAGARPQGEGFVVMSASQAPTIVEGQEGLALNTLSWAAHKWRMEKERKRG